MTASKASPRKGPWTRNTIACTNCRKRRTRCLGNPCAFCSKYGLQCQYEPLSAKQQQQTVTRSASSSGIGPNGHEASGSSQIVHELTTTTLAGAAQSQGALPGCPLSPPAGIVEDAGVADAMGQVGALAQQQQSGALAECYGSSSALSFVQAIIAAAPAQSSLSAPSWPSSANRAAPALVHGLEALLPDNEDPRVLPIRALADHLLQIYFDKSHDVLRLLHKPTLLQEYNSVWLPGAQTSYKFLALLNYIYALAHLFIAGGPSRESEHHCQRAGKCYEIGVSQEPLHLRDVQIELLKCHYLQGSSSAARCWRSLSKVISLAYAIGVNRTPRQSADPVARQLHLRAWLACRNLDAVISGTLGRLPYITHCSSALVPEPAEIEDEDIALFETVPNCNSMPCRISVFLWSARIYSVISQALQALYVPYDTIQTEISEHEEVKSMMELERDLSNLKTAIPGHLSLSGPGDPSAPSWAARHRVILRNRYFRARLLILRPALLRSLRLNTASPVGSNAAGREAVPPSLADSHRNFAQQASLATASEQIDFCSGNMDQQYDAPWYRRFYMCDCMSTLLACKVLGIGLENFEASWERAKIVFEATLPLEGSATLSRGLALLTSIKDQLDRPGNIQHTFSDDITSLLASCDVYLGTQGSDWIDAYLNFDQGSENANMDPMASSAPNLDFLNYSASIH